MAGEFDNRDLGSGVSRRKPSIGDIPVKGAPDYRSKMALYLLRNGHDKSPDRDKVTEHYMLFCRERETAKLEDFLRLQFKYPDFYMAQYLKEAAASGQDDRGKIIEAGILGKAAPEELAEYLDLPVSVVKAYISLFFDVTRQISRPGYIKTSILNRGKVLRTGSGAEEFLWKEICFHLGWEELKSCFQSGFMTPEMTRFVSAMGRGNELSKGCAASYIEALNINTSPSILERQSKASSPAVTFNLNEINHMREEEGDLAKVKSVMARISQNFRPTFWDEEGTPTADEQRYLPEGLELDARIVGKNEEGEPE